MRPGQLDPNDFERAILSRLALQEPSILDSLPQLRVLSREFTGVGSFTNFLCDESVSGSSDWVLGLDATILVPDIPEGLGAVVFCRGTQPECLEIYTYGDTHWDGRYDNFTIAENL
jgi:hypothetical protein